MKKLYIIILLAFIGLNSNAQGVVIIPTVVHVLWHTATENISDAQIYSQIDVLNQDFRKLNPDTVNIPPPFRQFAGDAKIEFCLAQRDTNGNATTGITRTNIAQDGFQSVDSITHTALGGDNSWNPFKYFNIWVVMINGALNGVTIGTATSPYNFQTNPYEDGVFIRPDFFGTIGTAIPIEHGRDATQQIGHWLNVYDTFQFGSGACLDDSVADTPPVDTSSFSYGCVPFPHNPNSICGTDSNGEMTSNFMTYADGSCQNFFTNGQIARMQNCLNTIRSGLLTSDGCTAVGINEIRTNTDINIYPNPVLSHLIIESKGQRVVSVIIYNTFGQIVNTRKSTGHEAIIDMNGEPSGIYYVRITADDGGTISKKIVKQ